ncbi:iron-containing redox enzyme family protein [Nocardia stercoris]|uniref:Iron-containing redox enzyme family protein n=1 Tax=Nocardia stercoris TaxID=2483361 RepID=A0A3M2L3J6_9NOCA|nr:iron-containing redox enzyme family protein [Nocardia stercoris]
MTAAPAARALPEPRGELSAAVVDALSGNRVRRLPRPVDADPFGDDLHLALYTAYEPHYLGFTGVHPDREWDLRLLRLRARLERCFIEALRDAAGTGRDLDTELDQLLAAPSVASGVSGFLRQEGRWWQVREYFAHRSIYHHKEADPYLWVVPRLRGQAKAALVAVEFDEFGGGRGDRVHARLFADLLDGASLDSSYLAYLDLVPAPMLAIVNMMSLFALHGRWRGALVGHFAAVEISSPPAAQRMVDALRAWDADPACVRFYAEHVVADAVHEQVLRRDVIGDLLRQEPGIGDELAFGIRATEFLEEQFERHLLRAWEAGRTSLRPPGLSRADAPGSRE